MRGPTPNWSHWTFQTVEWGRKTSSVHSFIPHATHFVLPDLPNILTPDIRNDFYKAIDKPANRIVTIAASQHTPASLEEWLQEHSHESDTLLIVGGNAKNSTSLSSAQAIRAARSAKLYSRVWAVANPNDKTSIKNVCDKLEADATGFITQPLLCSHAMHVLQDYPQDETTITYIAGLALPKTEKGLYFWLNLLNQPELVDDVLFRDHVNYFSSPHGADSLTWIQDQLSTLATDAFVHGIHYMPVNNTADLLSLLGDS